nr:hypothetical protein B0A51_05134 [Rachicladosporium sp. CCFEE 5018]
MPGLARKLHVVAAANGILIHPVSPKGKPDGSLGVQLKYNSGEVAAIALKHEHEASEVRIQAHGILGLLDLGSAKFLVCITQRDEVAQIRGKPIYVITDVTLLPLASQDEASKAVQSAAHLESQGNTAVHEDSDYEESEEGDVADINEETSAETGAALEAPEQATGVSKKEPTSFLKNVVQNKGKYGEFAGKWFSRVPPATKPTREPAALEEAPEAAQINDTRATTEPTESDETAAEEPSKSDTGNDMKTTTHKSNVETLTPRILRSAKLFFGSRSFYFSYGHDLSARLAEESPFSTSSPLHRRVDANFFWNRNLVKPFIDKSLDLVILPVIQGFVGQRAFSIGKSEAGENDVVVGAAEKPEEVVAAEGDEVTPAKQSDLLITIISRRSVKRAGLRYLRRGVDDNGSVANFVETEQILSTQDWSTEQQTFSLLQIRGSIPLFFSQTPYSAKPVPVLFGSEGTNHAALKAHFASMAEKYGQVQVASLVDKSGVEKDIGEAYENGVKWLNDPDNAAIDKQIAFEWFYFHKECGGMRFENVSILLSTLESSLKSHGWMTLQNNTVTTQQTGVLRTNCMDCLDRTNVTQSAVGAWALQQQLSELGLSIDLHSDPKTKWFNTLWADNGDAISRQYAGTAALKGDFTRTRKRNWTGALSDLSLTLNRYYNNIFGDYFLQACIDFYLGSVGVEIFDEFESEMMTRDHAIDMDKVRQSATEKCVQIVLEGSDEDLRHGWALSCPHEADSLRAMPFEECVLLLTDVALYFCRFDWSTEKVGSFEKVDLADITEIWRGTYVTSTLAPGHMDEQKNVGFAMRYKTNGHAIVRTNTRSMDNEKAVGDTKPEPEGKSPKKPADSRTDRLLAFKAVPSKTSSELDEVKQMCDEIHKTMMKVREMDHLDLSKAPAVQEKDVISLAEAKKATGYIESLGYSLKKLVWA